MRNPKRKDKSNLAYTHTHTHADILQMLALPQEMLIKTRMQVQFEKQRGVDGCEALDVVLM